MMRDKIKIKNLYKKTKHIAIKIMTNLDTKKNKITPLYFYKEKREIRGGGNHQSPTTPPSLT